MSSSQNPQGFLPSTSAELSGRPAPWPFAGDGPGSVLVRHPDGLPHLLPYDLARRKQFL